MKEICKNNCGKKQCPIIKCKPEKYECESCDEFFIEEDLVETTYKDADNDKQVKFLCGKCQEKAILGEL